MDLAMLFSIIGALISVGGIFVAVGVAKNRLAQVIEDNKCQDTHIKTLATKEELAIAIRRSDELLEIANRRADEDRAKGQRQWREFYENFARHAERIGIIENQQTLLMKSLDEIKDDIKSGFRQLRDEIKDLRTKI